jgi:predicted transcriptional regulator of viral defense system
VGRKGFVATDDVRNADVRQQTCRRHARRLGWEARYRLIWVPAGRRLDLQQEIALAVAATGPEVLVTGRSALFLAGIAGQPREAVELLIPARRHLAHRAGICLHRSTAYDEVRFRHTAEVRVASVPRAFADDAAHATVNEFCRDIATAVRLRQCTPPASASAGVCSLKRAWHRTGSR